jgi:hypothetical protein
MNIPYNVQYMYLINLKLESWSSQFFLNINQLQFILYTIFTFQNKNDKLKLAFLGLFYIFSTATFPVSWINFDKIN